MKSQRDWIDNTIHIFLIALLLLFICIGCASAKSEDSKPSAVIKWNETFSGYAHFITEYEDPDTHVVYIVMASSRGNSITPKLNPDGSLYVRE